METLKKLIELQGNNLTKLGFAQEGVEHSILEELAEGRRGNSFRR